MAKASRKTPVVPESERKSKKAKEEVKVEREESGNEEPQGYKPQSEEEKRMVDEMMGAFLLRNWEFWRAMEERASDTRSTPQRANVSETSSLANRGPSSTSQLDTSADRLALFSEYIGPPSIPVIRSEVEGARFGSTRFLVAPETWFSTLVSIPFQLFSIWVYHAIGFLARKSG